ncbi:hypothetical protein CANARDRAFT_208854 [[Candida] arabinofermentans NRRL YB-2248]|uniref:Ribose-5-phosphate isomerase n=1 Tax=[Candida] arabinofermentans NRRL YB-2248 TaxID=983967 RepID=A0A1E4SWR3_9ASCO|nr:hypothetical protein CANARDRAFT_208854 [[Candida] arabinofermentans NRRL YB-2248]
MGEDLIEKSKKLAGYSAVDQNLDPSYKFIGIGSGSTVVYVVERLGQLENKDRFICIPTSFQAKELIIQNGLRLGTIEEFIEIDIAFDGADEIDTDLNLIKGGGACLLQEKLVASCSKRFVVVADYRKNTGKLGKDWRNGVPIEVVSLSYVKVLKELKLMGGKAQLRDAGKAKAGPVITDNGNFIIDCDFGEIDIDKVQNLHLAVKSIVGVVETGLFVRMAQKAYIGNADGTLSVEKAAISRKFYSTLKMSDLVEQSKKLSAFSAVDDNLKPEHRIIGIGSGSTVVYVAERVGQNVNKKEFVCIPTGFQSKQLIIDNGLRLGSIEEYPEIDIAFDGADEIDTSLNCIKGGGACLLQEKLVADCSKEFVVVADYRKNTGILGKGWKKGVPIEVIPGAYTKILKELSQLGGKPVVRSGLPAKAGPVITDNGMFIIDCDFGEIPVSKVKELNDKIKAMVGVVETGLFVEMAKKAYIGNADGSVTTLTV